MVVTRDAVGTACEFLGVLLIAYGAHQVYPPAMWIWLGLAAFGVSYALALSEHEPTRPTDGPAQHDDGAGVD